MTALVLALGLGCARSTAAADDSAYVVDSFSAEVEPDGRPAGWQPLYFKGRPRHTVYTVEHEGTNFFVKSETVERLCRQAGVSRALFYQWLRRGREGLLQALEAKKPGRKPEQRSPEELHQLKDRIKRLEKDLAALLRERDRFQRMTEVAQRVIQRNGWNPESVRRIRKKKIRK